MSHEYIKIVDGEPEIMSEEEINQVKILDQENRERAQTEFEELKANQIDYITLINDMQKQIDQLKDQLSNNQTIQ